MKYRIISCLIVVFIAFFDQLSKNYVQSLISEGNLQVISNLSFVSVWNHGVSFGFGDNFPMANLLFVIITAIISIALVVTIWMTENKMIMIAAGTVLGGAIGNIIDRLRFGAVYDFIDMHIQNFHWPAFNIADAMIFIGIIMLFVGDVYAKYDSKHG